MRNVIKRAVDHCKSMRVSVIFNFSLYKARFYKLADPGKIVQTGISAGACDRPCLNWVQNILSKRLSEDFINKLDQEIAHVFSLVLDAYPQKISPVTYPMTWSHG